MDKPDNPQAFPLPPHDGATCQEFAGSGYAGMTLRDYFAAKAMQGMLAHSTRYKTRPFGPQNWHEAIAEEAFEIADAMLEARET